MSRKVVKKEVKKEVVTPSEPVEHETLLLFHGGKEVLPGDILTALEKLGYDTASPKLYDMMNDLEKEVTGKMSVVNIARVLKTKPTEDELRQVHRAFTLGDHNEIEVDESELDKMIEYMKRKKIDYGMDMDEEEENLNKATMSKDIARAQFKQFYIEKK